MTTVSEYAVPKQYMWYILILGTLTNALLSAIPSMCMPVLFEEVSRDLNLNLVQIGIIWGVSALPGIVTSILAGATGDRFGPRRVLIFGCLLVGLTGALRGLSVNFVTLMASMMLFGAFVPFITQNTLKNSGMWFPGQKLGLASGVLSMGMALGFLVTSMISATLLSPWLGGWRNVLFLYGAVGAALSIPWFFSRAAPVPAYAAARPSIIKNFGRIARIRNVWLYGLAMAGIGGCVQGALGYLPLYLRNLGWQPASADGALAAFHTVSMIFVVPIAIWSDRLRSRKSVLVAAGSMIILGMLLLTTPGGGLVWLAVLTAGMVRDGFMAVFFSSVIQTDGVGPEFAGTAIGITLVMGGLGSLIAPPLGNSLAAINSGLPFMAWAGLAAVGVAGLLLTSDRRVIAAAAVE